MPLQLAHGVETDLHKASFGELSSTRKDGQLYGSKPGELAHLNDLDALQLPSRTVAASAQAVVYDKKLNRFRGPNGRFCKAPYAAAPFPKDLVFSELSAVRIVTNLERGNLASTQSISVPCAVERSPKAPDEKSTTQEEAPTPQKRSLRLPEGSRASHGIFRIRTGPYDSVLLEVSGPLPKGKGAGESLAPVLLLRLPLPPDGVAPQSSRGIEHYQRVLDLLYQKLRHEEPIFQGSALNPFSKCVRALAGCDLIEARNVNFNGVTFSAAADDEQPRLVNCEDAGMFRKFSRWLFNSRPAFDADQSVLSRAQRTVRSWFGIAEAPSAEVIGIRDRIRTALYDQLFGVLPGGVYGQPLLGGLLRRERIPESSTSLANETAAAERSFATALRWRSFRGL